LRMIFLLRGDRDPPPLLLPLRQASLASYGQSRLHRPFRLSPCSSPWTPITFFLRECIESIFFFYNDYGCSFPPFFCGVEMELPLLSDAADGNCFFSAGRDGLLFPPVPFSRRWTTPFLGEYASFFFRRPFFSGIRQFPPFFALKVLAPCESNWRSPLPLSGR